MRRATTFFIVLAALMASAFGARAEGDAIVKQPWFETRTTHFNIYSCGATQEVYKVAARLEQFCDAYTLLAGAQAVASPPITVMAFPSHQAMEPFLPLYQGKPAHLSGFFKRSTDENLIVLELTGTNSGALDTIFHEYTHLLFRRNDAIWPLWLQEGMAEMYSTFEANGKNVRIGKPISHHLRLLAQGQWMPLSELLTAGHDSPQYNEMQHQGTFYAESWLLTHFLMNGDNAALKAGFKKFTGLLRSGQSPTQAFTNALQLPLPTIEAELRRYLKKGQFDPIPYVVTVDLSAPRAFNFRAIAPVETCFRLGNELMRINRLDDAQTYFSQAQQMAPASSLPYEGLGLLAAVREQPAESLTQLKEAFQRHSTNFLAYYSYAEQRYRAEGETHGTYIHIAPEKAIEIRAELQKSIALMPDFAPAHQLLGILELVQGENAMAAEQHLLRAIQLEPENQSYALSLAQAQMFRRDFAEASRTLEPLLHPPTNLKMRAIAANVQDEINRLANPKKP